MNIKYTSTILIVITTLGMTSICFASSWTDSIKNAFSPKSVQSAGNTVLQGTTEAFNYVENPSGGGAANTSGDPLTSPGTTQEVEDTAVHLGLEVAAGI